MTKLQRKHATALVIALRSGKWLESDVSKLRTGDRLSPAGLACELYRRLTGDGKWVYVGSNILFKQGGFSWNTIIPNDVYSYFNCYGVADYQHFDELSNALVLQLVHGRYA